MAEQGNRAEAKPYARQTLVVKRANGDIEHVRTVYMEGQAAQKHWEKIRRAFPEEEWYENQEDECECSACSGDSDEEVDGSDRTVPFCEKEICDACGAKGAFDFMGDLYCGRCIS
jgi:hypothetical protein